MWVHEWICWWHRQHCTNTLKCSINVCRIPIDTCPPLPWWYLCKIRASALQIIYNGTRYVFSSLKSMDMVDMYLGYGMAITPTYIIPIHMRCALPFVFVLKRLRGKVMMKCLWIPCIVWTLGFDGTQKCGRGRGWEGWALYPNNDMETRRDIVPVNVLQRKNLMMCKICPNLH